MAISEISSPTGATPLFTRKLAKKDESDVNAERRMVHRAITYQGPPVCFNGADPYTVKIKASRSFAASASRPTGTHIQNAEVQSNVAKQVLTLSVAACDRANAQYSFDLSLRPGNFGKYLNGRFKHLVIFDLKDAPTWALWGQPAGSMSQSEGFDGLYLPTFEALDRCLQNTNFVQAQPASKLLRLPISQEPAGKGQERNGANILVPETSCSRRSARGKLAATYPKVCAIYNAEDILIGALMFHNLDGGKPTLTWYH